MVASSSLGATVSSVGKVTTLHFDLDDRLHRRAKARAAAEGIPLKAWVTRAIQHELEASKDDDEDDR